MVHHCTTTYILCQAARAQHPSKVVGHDTLEPATCDFPRLKTITPGFFFDVEALISQTMHLPSLLVA